MPVKVSTYGETLNTYQKISVGEKHWHVAEEVPVAFVYNRRNYAIMMATPADLVDFGVGFSITERIVATEDEILSLDIYHSDRGVDFRFDIHSTALARLDVIQRRRKLVGSASCGLCGLENADALTARLPTVSKTRKILDDGAMSKAMHHLADFQPLNAKTRSVHAAAWVEDDGNILLCREDVGRHNAVDKLLGALVRDAVDKDSGFLIVSSRCSYEIVEKAAHFGIQSILSISGPTNFALRKAEEANMSIYARSNEGAVKVV